MSMNSPSAYDSERFLAFAFAAAEIVVETDLHGCITFAAGAIRSKFGREPEALLGQALRELISPEDCDSVYSALSLLARQRRLLPMIVRLSDPKGTAVALAGLALEARENRPRRLCLTFARQPTSAGSVAGSEAVESFLRTTQARLRVDAPSNVGLLEINVQPGRVPSREALHEAVKIAAPDSVTSLIGPGQFALLSNDASDLDLLSSADLLEATLRNQGIDVAVKAHNLSLSTNGLSTIQVARALRRALDVFARDGIDGLGPAGFGHGLAAYVQGAARQADSLRRAIRDGHFDLAYQPIVSLVDRRTHHYEALIRPRPIDDCPFTGPQDFVVLVEALGLHEELDGAVATAACAAAAATGKSVAFNLSSQSVQSSSFRKHLVKLLTASAAGKAGLMLVEMTETADVTNMEEAGLTADALEALGVPFCLDDFGAGANGIRLLRSLSVSIVKLDGSYVVGVTTAGRERGFVAGMVELARAAGVEIVAEKVETEAEAEALQQLGVHYGQGWLFGRPGPLPGL